MHYDLTKLTGFATTLGMEADLVCGDLLRVRFGQDVVLVFKNYTDSGGCDCLMAFEGTPWHSHCRLGLAAGDDDYLELDEFQVLQGISDGDIVAAESLVDGEVRDRWLHHVEGPEDLRCLEPNEELRFRKLA